MFAIIQEACRSGVVIHKNLGREPAGIQFSPEMHIIGRIGVLLASAPIIAVTMFKIQALRVMNQCIYVLYLVSGIHKGIIKMHFFDGHFWRERYVALAIDMEHALFQERHVQMELLGLSARILNSKTKFE